MAGVAGAGFARHRSGAEVVHRLPARIAANGPVVGLQLVDFELRPDLPRLLRLVLHAESLGRVNFMVSTAPLRGDPPGTLPERGSCSTHLCAERVRGVASGVERRAELLHHAHLDQPWLGLNVGGEVEIRSHPVREAAFLLRSKPDPCLVP